MTRNFIAWLLVPALICPQLIQGQTMPSRLRILVLQGDGAVNVIPSRLTTEPVIEVQDENNLPVPGATVVFQLPAAGAGGYFPGQQLTFTTRTNQQGQAAAQGFAANTEPGQFRIRVSATAGNRTGSAFISQTNSDREVQPKMSKSSRRRILIISLVAAGAAGAGLYFALRSSDKTVVLVPGSVSVGGGR